MFKHKFKLRHLQTNDRLQNQLDCTEKKWSRYSRSILTMAETNCFSERDRRYCQPSNLCIDF